MSRERMPRLDKRTTAALGELQGIIHRRYSEVTFAVAHGEDPDGIYLKATVDLDDVDEVIDQELLDRLFDMQVDQGLPVYVIPLQPVERVLAAMEKHAVRPLPRLPMSEGRRPIVPQP